MTPRPRTKISIALRNRIFARDARTCVYCTREESETVPLTLDHVVPHSVGGPDVATNLVTACGDCNTRRATFPVDLYAELLRREGIQDVAERVLAALSTPLPVLPAKK